MKKIIAFLILVLFVIQISAQTKKNIFRTEISPVFQNSKKINGFSITNEFSRQFAKNFSLGLSLEHKTTHSKSISSISNDLGLNIYYNINVFNFCQVQLGTGTYVEDFTKYTNFSSSSVIDYHSFDTPIYKFNSLKYNSFGYTFSFGLIIPLNNFIALSFRTVFRDDTIKKISTSVKSGIAVKF